MMLEFIVKTSEEELLLAGGLDGRDEFGGGVIDIGADESPMYGRYLLSGTALRA